MGEKGDHTGARALRIARLIYCTVTVLSDKGETVGLLSPCKGRGKAAIVVGISPQLERAHLCASSIKCPLAVQPPQVLKAAIKRRRPQALGRAEEMNSVQLATNI
jgi:hypothetical protein